MARLLGILSSHGLDARIAVPAGYILGGYDGSSDTYYSTTNKLTYSNETRSITTSLVTAQENGAGVSNSSKAGYKVGGYDTDYIYTYSTKVTFAGDVFSTLSITIPSGYARLNQAPHSNHGTAGYITSGSSETNSFLTTSYKLGYSAETYSTISDTINTGVAYAGGLSNSGTAGYIAGGMRNVSYQNTSRVDKISYSNDTRSSTGMSVPGGSLGGTRQFANSIQNKGSAGYYAAGYNGSSQNTFLKVDFSNDTMSTLGATLTYALINPCGIAYEGTAGYVCGGWNQPAGSTRINGIDKLLFSNETKSTLSATLSYSASFHTGVSNSGNI